MNGNKSGMGVSGCLDEKRTRRGLVGLTRNIRCLTVVRMRVYNRGLVVSAHKRHERATVT